MSDKARVIIKRVAELFSYGTSQKTAEQVALENFERLITKEEEWEKAFADYEVEDVLMAINKYWNYKTDKQRPTVAHILAILQTDKEAISPVKHEEKEKYLCIESQLMERDKELKRNSNFLIQDYRRAVDYILEEELANLIGKENHKNLSMSDKIKERTAKYQLALKKGLFNNFDYYLRMIKNN